MWRLAVALIISSGCFIGTKILFDGVKENTRPNDKPPMARLQSAINEVQRKPLKRVIWESINKNEDLYPGEAVRTAPNAEAQLYVNKTKTTIRLDPDSLVVLEENEKGLSLDFLQGNVFVQSLQGPDAKSSESLTLKTGNGEIKLKSADLSLSKNKNGNVDLEVHRGEAELAQGTKKTSLNKDKRAELSATGVNVSNDRLDVLSPQAEESLFLNLIKGEQLEVTWKPLPKGYKISLELERARADLGRSAKAEAAGEAGQLKVAAKPGKWYLHLLATSPDPKQPRIGSAVLNFTIQPKSPPQLDEPRKDAIVIMPDAEAKTAFKWATPHRYSSQVLEIATDPLFTKLAHRENFFADKADSNQFALKLNEGAYYWRMTGFLKVKGKSETLSSKPNPFTLVAKWELKPPTLISPIKQQHLSVLDIPRPGVALKWQTAKGMERVKVELQAQADGQWKSILDQETETTSIAATELHSGNYRWRVATVDVNGGPSKYSAYESFTIDGIPKLEWVETQPTVDYEYATPTPTVRGHWRPSMGGVASYRFKLNPEAEGAANGTWQSTKQTLFDTAVPAEGRYFAQVEALNAKGVVIAQSESKIFNVKQRPLLPPPQWSANTPEILKGDGKGNLSFTWEQVEGAERYLMVLESPDGTVVEKREIARNLASLTKVNPGRYRIELRSIDGIRRAGPPGNKRDVEVPERIRFLAPKIKAMKVK